MRRALLFCFTLPLLAGCNTVQGVGRDLQALGRVLADSAGDAQTSMQATAGTETHCDPNGGELAGSDLPPCPTNLARATPPKRP